MTKTFVAKKSENFYLDFRSLIMIQISNVALFWIKTEESITKTPTNQSKKLSNVSLCHKLNLWKSSYRKMLNSKLLRNLPALYLHWTLEKWFQVINIIKILKFEGDWGKLWKKNLFGPSWLLVTFGSNK